MTLWPDNKRYTSLTLCPGKHLPSGQDMLSPKYPGNRQKNDWVRAQISHLAMTAKQSTSHWQNCHWRENAGLCNAMMFPQTSRKRTEYIKSHQALKGCTKSNTPLRGTGHLRHQDSWWADADWCSSSLVDWCFEQSTTRDYIRAEGDFHKGIYSWKAER